MALANPTEALKFLSNVEYRGNSSYVNRNTLQTYCKLRGTELLGWEVGKAVK